MIRTTLLSFFLLTQTPALFAQYAQHGTTTFSKNARACLYADYPYDASLVEGALKKKLGDAGLVSDSKAGDGFRVYKGVVFNVLSAEKIDLYWKVEEKKPQATVYLMASKGYDNFLKRETDSLILENGLAFLNRFANDVQAFKLNRDMAAQQERITDEEKKARALAKEAESLQKQKSKLESKIATNRIETGSLKSDWENQQKTLETIRTKTATLDQMEALKKEMAKQEDAVEKAEKKYRSSVKDGEELAADLQEAEQDIAKNKSAQETQAAEVKRQKEALEALRSELSRIPIQ